jgi:D-inositol-3-phosphate glycosyltransferase
VLVRADGRGASGLFDAPRSLARNSLLLAGVLRRRAEEEPVRLAVLAVRRLPGRLRDPVARVLLAGTGASGRPAARALGHVLADHPDRARSLLLGTADAVSGRLGSELAVELSVPLPDDAPVALRARASWQRGDLEEAVVSLRTGGSRSARRQGRRLASEVDLHRPGHRLRRRAPGAPGAAAATSGSGVLHLLTNSLPRTQSGYALRSHAVLRAQSDAGLEVEAVTRLAYPVTVGLPWAPPTDVVEGVHYRRLLPRRLADTPEGRLEQTVDLLLDRVDVTGPGLLHTTTHFPNALVAEAVASARGLPWVYEMRGQLERTWLASRPAELRTAAAASQRYRWWSERELEMAAAADHVVVLSEVLRRHVVEGGVDPARVTVVPNGVDAHLIDADPVAPADARRALGLPVEGLWVGTVSSLVGYEGLDTLLRAVALLRSDGLDVRCALVGDGVSRPGLLTLAAELGLGEHAVLPGRVLRDRATDWHRALDVFAVPRQDTPVARTVTPLKPIEAMSVGRPVVASDLPALAEVVGEPGTGLLATPGDPEDLAGRIRELSEDPVLRARLGARGREFAATRTWQALARRYLSVYENLGVST